MTKHRQKGGVSIFPLLLAKELTVRIYLYLYAIILFKEIVYIYKRSGELSVHEISDTLGDVVKAARENKSITIECLAEKLGISERYLYRIENEHKKPSYSILYKLIRELGINPDNIFYPEKNSSITEFDSIIRQLYTCDKRSLQIVQATLQAALESQTIK